MNLLKNNTIFSRTLSMNSVDIFSTIEPKKFEINELFNLILKNSESNQINFETELSLYISNNKNKNQIIQKIFEFINKNNLHYLTILKCLNCMVNSITENYQILFFVNETVPLLVNYLFKNSKDSAAIKIIINYICQLIRIVKQSSTKEIIEKIIDNLFEKYRNMSEINNKNTYETYKYIFIMLSVKMTKNSPNLLNKYLEAPRFKETLKIFRECFKDKNEEIRKAIGESAQLYVKFIQNKYKGSELYTIKRYYDISYEELILGYSNNIPNNYYVISGFMIFLKNVYEAKPSFFKNPTIYIKLMDELIKCKNCGINNLNIIIEFIKNIPLLNKLNIKIFKERYSKVFIDYAISLFNNKTDIFLRNQLFLCLGEISFNFDEMIFSLIISPLISFINSIFTSQKNINDEIFKCISDLLNNKAHYYIEVIITNFDIYTILPLIFKTPLSIYKIEFLITITNCYKNFTMENISTVITALNVISIIFGFNDFKLDNFNRFVDNSKEKFISSKLEDILIITKKNTLKYIYENKKNYKNNTYNCISSSNINYANSNEISYALILLSQIKNNLFFKDILIFYNDKILPLLPFVNNKICRQILEIILSDFIKIYNDDVNLSEYVMKNIIHSLINTFMVNKNSDIKIIALKIMRQKKFLHDSLNKEYEPFFDSLIGQLLSTNEKELHEEIIKLIKEFSFYDNFRNYLELYFKIKIYYISNKIINSNNHYFSNIISDKFINWVKYFKHLFNEETFNNSMLTSIYLLITYIDTQNIIRINGLLLIDDLLESDYLKNNKNKEIIKNFCNICYICCIYLFKKYSSINSCIAICSTKIIYNLIKYCNFSIYKKLNSHEFMNYIISNNKIYTSYKDKLKIYEFNKKFLPIIKEIENVDVFYLLFEYIIKVEKNINNITFLNIIDIFGLCGPASIFKYRSLYSDQKKKLGLYLEFLNEGSNKYKNIIEISDLSNINISDIKAVIFLMQTIKNNELKQLSIKIIDYLEKLIKEIKPTHHSLIDVILKTIILIIPKYKIIYQKKLFQNILLIEELFPNKIANYLDDIMNLIINYTKKNYFDIVYKLYTKILQDFSYCIEVYYSTLIPKFITIIKSEIKESASFIKLLTLMTKNNSIYPYLEVIVKEITVFYLRDKNSKQTIQCIFSLLEEISQISNTFLLYQIIITNLLDKLKIIFNPLLIRNLETKNEYKIKKTDIFVSSPNNELNILIVQNTLKIFNIMSNKYKNQFSPFLLDIINTFINIGIFKFSFCKGLLYKLVRENNHLFIDSINYAKKIKSLFNQKNCSISFAKMKKILKNDNILNEAININISNIEIVRKKTMNPNMNKKSKIESIFNKRYQIDKELILKKFNNTYCNLEEDWNDWYKSLCVILFEQSPNYILKFCHLLIDLNFPLIKELLIYAFYSFYINTNDSDKIAITKYLKNALQNSKTPNYILLTILNGVEYMEKKNINMSLMDYQSFGNIAYKNKAFAKTLYYVENSFSIKNNEENFEKLTSLYSILNLTENAEGLIKMANNNNFNDLKNSNKKYIWYVNIFEFDKALKIIEKQLPEEKNLEEIKNLKKYKNICLNGLCDWEKIIENDETENENYIDNSNLNDLKTNLEKEYISMISNFSLCKWDKLKEHVNKLNKIFAENFDLEDIRLNNDENVYNIDIENKDINEDIQIHLNNDLFKKMSYLIFKEKSDEKINTNTNKILFTNYQSSFNFKNNPIENENNIFQYSEIADHCKFEVSEEIIFSLNIFAAIANYIDNKYEISKKYLKNAKNLVLKNMNGLLNESCISCYFYFIKNQIINNLEQFINYKQYHLNDEKYLNQMKLNSQESFKNIEKNPRIYRKFISIYSLLFPIEEEYNKYIELVNIYRKINDFTPCFKILNFLREKLRNSDISEKKNNDLQLIEMKIKIELCYNKCLFGKGNINEAVIMAEKLVKLLDDNELNSFNKINDELKSKIYSNFAIYKNKQCELTKIKILQIKSEKKINNKFFRQKSFNISNSKKIELLNLNPVKSKNFSPLPVYLKNDAKNLSNLVIEKLSKNDVILENINDQFYYKAEKINDINKLLLISTKYNKNSYKNWHNFAMINYQFHKYLLDNIEEPFFKNILENYANKHNEKNFAIKFAINALNGFKKSLMITGKNYGKIFQDLMPLIDIFFEKRNKNDEILDLINQIFNEVEIEIFLFVIPQLTCRFTGQDPKKVEILINLLNRIGIIYPKILMFYLIPVKLSNSLKKQSIADQILYCIFKKNKLIKNIYEKYKLFMTELNKCAVLLHEEWHQAIETAKKLMFNKDINGIIEELIPLHIKMNIKPESLYEINFYQKFENELKKAKSFLMKAKNYDNFDYITEAWEIYQSIYRKINAEYKNMNSFSLEYVSPKLYNLEKNFYSISSLNTVYYPNNNEMYKTIKKIHNIFHIFNSKQKPRKIIFIMENDKQYNYLLKGKEDLRQDYIIVQIFNIINTIIARDRISKNKDLFISLFNVVILSYKSGLISWINNSDSMNKIILEQRNNSDSIPNIELKTLNNLYPKYESGNFLSKVEIFKEILKETSGTEISRSIWIKSENCETWLEKRTNFSTSLAIMSIAGYIIGLGDRHPENLLMNKENGKIVHIDFGDCFETTMNRLSFPEKVPFRLTRMLVKALGIIGVEGTFRKTCEKIMELLRKNKDLILSILNALIYETNICFRYIIPNIIKLQKQKKSDKNNNEIKKINIHINNSNHILTDSSFRNKNFCLSAENNISNKKVSIITKKLLKGISPTSKNFGHLVNKTKNVLKDENKDEEKLIINLLNEVKNEKNLMQREENQILKYYEEKEEIEYEETNKIAQIIKNRIIDKLTGMDFNTDYKISTEEQVDRLINQATSNENLAQSYLGWCPFW